MGGLPSYQDTCVPLLPPPPAAPAAAAAAAGSLGGWDGVLRVVEHTEEPSGARPALQNMFIIAVTRANWLLTSGEVLVTRGGGGGVRWDWSAVGGETSVISIRVTPVIFVTAVINDNVNLSLIEEGIKCQAARPVIDKATSYCEGGVLPANV